jgi:signal transduction histidine kinase
MRLVDKQLAAVEDGADIEEPLATLRLFVDEDVLPLSHRLAALDVSLGGYVPTTVESDSIPWIRPRRLEFGAVIRPALTGTVVGLIAAGSAGNRLPFWQAIVVVLFVVLTSLAYLSGVRFLLRGKSAPVLAALLVSAASTAFLLGMMVSLLLLAFGVNRPGSIMLFSVLGAFVGALAWLAAVIDARYSLTEYDLQYRISQLRDSVSRTQQQLRMQRQRIGYALHGGVQAAAHAAALRLMSADPVTPEVVRGIRLDLVQAGKRLRSDISHQISFDEMCQSIAQTWEGTCQVTWQITDQAKSALDTHPTTASCGAEVVLEAVQNAIKHGKASLISIHASREEDRLVLQIRNNGVPSHEGKTGLGTQMLDTFCSHWRREPLESGSLVFAELPLN